jgi:8-oxo-dGTP pyrophosphatase MutT (NUDIX family)
MTDAVEVRDAATVVLLRDGPGGVEAWLLTRTAQMVFAAGMTVFPGGRVDPADADLPWRGRPPEEVAVRLGTDAASARVLVGAAVRETFEETGVLLTVPPADLTGATTAAADVEAGRASFGRLLREHGLAIDADALRPWARWVTPVGEVRRYDTRFFVAGLPPGATPIDLSSESSTAGWLPVREALTEGERGERLLMPPTAAALRSVGAHGTVAAVLAAAGARDLAPVRPVLRHDADGPRVLLPDGTTVPRPSSGRST